MLSFLTAAAGVAFKLARHIGGSHLTAGAASTGLAIAEALGFRFFAGFAAALYATRPDFRAGILEAVKAVIP